MVDLLEGIATPALVVGFQVIAAVLVIGFVGAIATMAEALIRHNARRPANLFRKRRG
jgi:NADH:ubiquinone oxidoreductase subunit 6 (subunit J)